MLKSERLIEKQTIASFGILAFNTYSESKMMLRAAESLKISFLMQFIVFFWYRNLWINSGALELCLGPQRPRILVLRALGES